MTSNQIIESLKTKFQLQELESIHISDLSLEYDITVHPLNQYIIGLVPDERFRGGGTEYYQSYMAEKIKNVSPYFTSFSYPFHEDEKAELKQVLMELIDHYDVKLDIERVYRKSGLDKLKDTCYIVITVVQYRIISDKPE